MTDIAATSSSVGRIMPPVESWFPTSHKNIPGAKLSSFGYSMLPGKDFRGLHVIESLNKALFTDVERFLTSQLNIDFERYGTGIAAAQRKVATARAANVPFISDKRIKEILGPKAPRENPVWGQRAGVAFVSRTEPVDSKVIRRLEREAEALFKRLPASRQWRSAGRAFSEVLRPDSKAEETFLSRYAQADHSGRVLVRIDKASMEVGRSGKVRIVPKGNGIRYDYAELDVNSGRLLGIVEVNVEGGKQRGDVIPISIKRSRNVAQITRSELAYNYVNNFVRQARRNTALITSGMHPQDMMVISNQVVDDSQVVGASTVLEKAVYISDWIHAQAERYALLAERELKGTKTGLAVDGVSWDFHRAYDFEALRGHSSRDSPRSGVQEIYVRGPVVPVRRNSKSIMFGIIPMNPKTYAKNAGGVRPSVSEFVPT